MGYPYDIAYIRWSGHGDNASPDPAICEFVKQWNAEHAWPKFKIASTSEAFRAFEARYGDKLPRVRGDWTPYWEDGAGSSALETGLNRASADRLSQAETLWAMLDPASYPAGAFEASLAQRPALFRAHLGGVLLDHRAGGPAHPGSMADQAVVRRAGESPVPRARWSGRWPGGKVRAIPAWPAPISMFTTRRPGPGPIW